jgi:uncharacterized protein YpmS
MLTLFLLILIFLTLFLVLFTLRSIVQEKESYHVLAKKQKNQISEDLFTFNKRSSDRIKDSDPTIQYMFDLMNSNEEEKRK